MVRFVKCLENFAPVPLGMACESTASVYQGVATAGQTMARFAECLENFKPVSLGVASGSTAGDH